MGRPQQICRWHDFADAAALAQAAVERILQAAQQAISRHGVFCIVLAGGSTPRRVYEMLRTSATDWSAWQVYFGDERCLPPQDSERNSRMAETAWLDHVAIPRGQIHPIPAELGPERAADAYAREVAGVDEFDLVLLGLGEDGHTASLFPGQDWGVEANAPAALPVFGAPKPPPQRVSLSARRLAQAREVVFLVSGAGKRQAVADWRAGKAIPAAAIMPQGGADILLADLE